MTGCECPIAGYCDRHKMNKNGRLHLLCSTDQLYFDRWERVANDPNISEERQLRRQRVVARIQEEKRFIDWCESMRNPEDKGLGDTVHNLLTKCGKGRRRSTARKRIVEFMKIYSCVRKDARQQLNERFPYRVAVKIAQTD